MRSLGSNIAETLGTSPPLRLRNTGFPVTAVVRVFHVRYQLKRKRNIRFNSLHDLPELRLNIVQGSYAVGLETNDQ
jgi:hypothetical protein